MNAGNIPYRIRIGVVAECVPADAEGFRKNIPEIIGPLFYESKIFSLYKQNSRFLLRSAKFTPVAYTVVSCFLEGAERLIANEILKQDLSRILVVLPFVEEEYLQELSSDQARDEYRALFRPPGSKARRPKHLQKEKLLTNGGDVRIRRQEAYRRAGEYIVDHCDVLVAGWDSASPGRTADAVAYAQAKGRPVFIISPSPPFSVLIYEGYGLNGESIARFELFNSFPLSSEKLKSSLVNAYGETFCDNEDPDLEKIVPDESKEIVREFLLPYYARGTEVATHFKQIYQRAGLRAYCLSVVAVASVAIGTQVSWLSPFAFAFEFIVLFWILGIIYRANRERSHQKWIESRFLTERLRSAIFMAACGVEASPIYIPPFMGIAHGPDDWMVMTFNEIWNRVPVQKGCEGESCARLSDFARKMWIHKQVGYHKDNADTMGKKSKRLETAGWLLFGVAMIAAMIHCLLFWPNELHAASLHHGLAFLAITLPALAAALEGIRRHREYSRLSKLSENMAANLMELERRFELARTPDALDVLLRETEELMLRESQSWLMVMRFIKLEPVL